MLDSTPADMYSLAPNAMSGASPQHGSNGVYSTFVPVGVSSDAFKSCRIDGAKSCIGGGLSSIPAFRVEREASMERSKTSSVLDEMPTQPTTYTTRPRLGVPSSFLSGDNYKTATADSVQASKSAGPSPISIPEPGSRAWKRISKNTAKRRPARKLTTKEQANFQCMVKGCGKFFSRSYNFKSHMETHDEKREYPFPCQEPNCTKKFVRKTDLQRHHQSVHTKERNHKCDFCGRLFARADTRRRFVVSKSFMLSNCTPISVDITSLTQCNLDTWKTDAPRDSSTRRRCHMGTL
jgi:hypothetical protein